MPRFFRAVIFMACFLTAGSAFAAGGACPSVVPVTGNNCYFIAANGADSNNGTTESTPWLHAPAMSTYTGGHTPVAGEGYIFRGGDTWHFGNSGASPYTGGTWSWGQSGTSSNPIYIGVDPTWFSGGAWARPILTGDNQTSTSPVTSCAHQIGVTNRMFEIGSQNYVVFDNFELTGLCYGVALSAADFRFAKDTYINERDGTHNIYENLYLHGWTHVQFNCTLIKSGVFTGEPQGFCFEMEGILGSEVKPSFDVHSKDIFDGSDSDPAGLIIFFGGAYDIHQSVFRYGVGLVISGDHLFYDNLMEYLYQPGDGIAHGNVYEGNGSAIGTNAYYNNVVRHICPVANCGVVNWWPWTEKTSTGYFFNNLMYDINATNNGANYFDIGQHVGQPQGHEILFNNTFEQPITGAAILDCSSEGGVFPLTLANNHYVIDGTSPYASPCVGQETAPPKTELRMTHAAATARGYTAAQTFAYSPTASNSPTVGTGTNEQSFCTALSAAGLSDAATACQNDTGYACAYNTGNHTVSCPARTPIPRPVSGAWDKGPYQSGGIVPSPPSPPTGLAATLQ